MNSKELLELQSDRIEIVLNAHKSPARVTGGIVTPRAILFNLAPALGTKVSKVQALTEELALALGVSSMHVSRQGSGVQLAILRDDAQPVKLLSMMAKLEDIPAYTAVLGLCDDGAPLLVRLPSPDVGHVLISGARGSGKATLLKSIVLSMAMAHRRSQLQVVLTSALRIMTGLPHQMYAKPLTEFVSLLGRIPEPRIMIVIGELADIVKSPDDKDALIAILRSGRESGIHVVAATRIPSILDPELRAGFPIRLIGKVESPKDAHAASDVAGTGAEKLSGRGDFIAVAAGQVIRFQAAYVSNTEIGQVVAQLGSRPMRWDMQGRPSLLHKATQVVA